MDIFIVLSTPEEFLRRETAREETMFERDHSVETVQSVAVMQ